MSPCHLKELLYVPTTDEASGIPGGLTRMIKNLSQGLAPVTLSFRPQMQMFYLEHGIKISKHETLRDVLYFFDSQEVKSSVIYLRLAKCSVLWPSEPDINDRLPYRTDLQQHYGSVTKILRTPIGCDDLFLDSISLHLRKL